MSFKLLNLLLLTNKLKKMKIEYSRTACIRRCPAVHIGRIPNIMTTWTNSDNGICVTRYDIISYLNGGDSQQDETYLFILEVYQQIKGEFEDVIFIPIS